MRTAKPFCTNITEAFTELEPDSTWMLAHDEDGKVMVVAIDDAEKWSFADDHFEFTLRHIHAKKA